MATSTELARSNSRSERRNAPAVEEVSSSYPTKVTALPISSQPTLKESGSPEASRRHSAHSTAIAANTLPGRARVVLTAAYSPSAVVDTATATHASAAPPWDGRGCAAARYPAKATIAAAPIAISAGLARDRCGAQGARDNGAGSERDLAPAAGSDPMLIATSFNLSPRSTLARHRDADPSP